MKKTISLLIALFSVNVSAASDIIIGDERAIKVHLKQEQLTSDHKQTIIAAGERLFAAKFTRQEGAGRPAATAAEVPVKRRATSLTHSRTAGPDANACSGCHNQPTIGGAGDFVANAFTAEGITNTEFTTIDPQFSNERGTTHLHGSGYIELLAREITEDLHNIRKQAIAQARAEQQAITVKLLSKGISFGEITALPSGFMESDQIQGIDQDLVLRPFGQKGVFTSLRQFSINAMNTHHGMQSPERWGKTWTNSDDFDEDGIREEITVGDITALTLFQALLPAPQTILPQHPVLQEAAATGEQLFSEAACDQCHIKSLPLRSLTFTEPGPYNLAGNLRQSDTKSILSINLPAHNFKKNAKGEWLIPVFSDLKRHVIADNEKPHFANEHLSQRFSARDEFMTAKLWGLASTAPYGHRGDLSTMKEAILQHGGEAKASRMHFESLSDNEQRQLIEFLKTLQLSIEPLLAHSP